MCWSARTMIAKLKVVPVCGSIQSKQRTVCHRFLAAAFPYSMWVIIWTTDHWNCVCNSKLPLVFDTVAVVVPIDCLYVPRWRICFVFFFSSLFKTKTKSRDEHIFPLWLGCLRALTAVCFRIYFVYVQADKKMFKASRAHFFSSTGFAATIVHGVENKSKLL